MGLFSFLERLFGGAGPAPVGELPDDQSGLIRALRQRRHWCSLGWPNILSLLRNAQGDTGKLKDAIRVAEKYGAIERCSSLLTRGTYTDPLSALATCLGSLGFQLMHQGGPTTAADAQAAFEGALLCDPLSLGSCAGLAVLWAGMGQTEQALHWCEVYRARETELRATPDEELTHQQQAMRDLLDPAVLAQSEAEFRQYAPDFLPGPDMPGMTWGQIVDAIETALRESSASADELGQVLYVKAFRSQMARYEDMLFGVRLFSEGIKRVWHSNPDALARNARSFSSTMARGDRVLSEAQWTLDQVKTGALPPGVLSEFVWPPWTPEMTDRATGLLTAYDKLFPGRPRELPLTDEEHRLLMDEVVEEWEMD